MVRDFDLYLPRWICSFAGDKNRLVCGFYKSIILQNLFVSFCYLGKNGPINCGILVCLVQTLILKCKNINFFTFVGYGRSLITVQELWTPCVV